MKSNGPASKKEWTSSWMIVDALTDYEGAQPQWHFLPPPKKSDVHFQYNWWVKGNKSPDPTYIRFDTIRKCFLIAICQKKNPVPGYHNKNCTNKWLLKPKWSDAWHPTSPNKLRDQYSKLSKLAYFLLLRQLSAHTPGTAAAQWLRCCATNQKIAGSITDGVIGIFHWHNPSDRTMGLGLTQSLTEISTRRISWG